VSREFSDRHPEIPWADIIGMRHKVVHDYLGVDEDIVWQVVTDAWPRPGGYVEPSEAAWNVIEKRGPLGTQWSTAGQPINTSALLCCI
jgi:Protein of unknown function DUF86